MEFFFKIKLPQIFYSQMVSGVSSAFCGFITCAATNTTTSRCSVIVYHPAEEVLDTNEIKDLTAQR